MRPFAEILVLFALLTASATASYFDHYKKEGHNIMKRMAEGDEVYEEHDIATVHLVEGQNRRRKRMTREDLRALSNNGITNRLQLALSSGSKLNLALTSTDIAHPSTVVSYHTENGYVEGKRIATDCYFYGQMEDSTGIGWAAISHCDGVFGFARSPAYEYFLHPVTSRRSKRNAGEHSNVHVLWRRSQSNTSDNDTFSDGLDNDDVEAGDDDAIFDEDGTVMMADTVENNHNQTKVVIEMAMFSDEQFTRRLRNSYPGREDDFLLTRLAGTQAMYGDSEKVGYDVKIKLKLLEYWTTNPASYTFAEDFPNNLRSFCSYTARHYHYDVHALNTGILRWNNGLIGLAYVGNICKKKRCFVLKGIDYGAFVGFGHELGHTMGLSHRNTANCPTDRKRQGGFMGGGSSLFFAPCMSYKLSRFFHAGNGKCLFKENTENRTPEEYQSVPSLFPGQSTSPDKLCHELAGKGYNYLSNKRPVGGNVCSWFICLNEDKDSPEYLRTQRFFAPLGFPCKAEAFCTNEQTCRRWDMTKMTLDPETLRKLSKKPQWSEWSAELTPCSRSCGTGVRVRRRVCQYADYNLALPCPGMPVKPELCNTQPCEGEPTILAEYRRIRRDEVCERFFQNNVRLRMKKADAYLPRATNVAPEDTGVNIPVGHSRSCLLKCIREPRTVRGEVDAIVPDGTLCFDYHRAWADLNRLNLDMRCLRGQCHEFSDCPDGTQIKDDCGICDGDGSRCFNLTVNPQSFQLTKGMRSELTVIPPFSTNIDAYYARSKGIGIALELWSHDDVNIIGEDGQYPRANYEGSQTVEFAGTRWTYKPREAYLRTAGPTNESVKIKITPIRKVGVKKLTIHYARSP